MIMVRSDVQGAAGIPDRRDHRPGRSRPDAL